MRTAWLAPSLSAALFLLIASSAGAQYPPPQQAPYPPAPQPQPGPQPPYSPAPAPQQPYPPPPQSQQPYYPPPQQPYPQQQQQPPPSYGQPPAGYGPAPQQPYSTYPAPYQAPPPIVQPVRPPPNRYRSPGEMAYLFGVGLAYGVGTGIWVDAIGNISDPGIAFIPPVAIGAAVPLGIYLWDQNAEFDRGVPSSMATGMLLGGLEGIAVSGLQWQLTGNGGPNSWGFPTWATITFLTATGGGIGGYAFGEWLQPDPRSLGFIASGAGWGAIAGILFGSGVVSGDWKDGAAVWGFAGYNAGVVATGALSTFYVPSWQTIKYMWLGDLIGTLATTPVYFFYIGSSADPRHGLIANAVGGLAGIGIAAALTANMKDDPATASSGWVPPFQISIAPTPYGGAELSAFGQF